MKIDFRRIPVLEPFDNPYKDPNYMSQPKK